MRALIILLGLILTLGGIHYVNNNNEVFCLESHMKVPIFWAGGLKSITVEICPIQFKQIQNGKHVNINDALLQCVEN